MVRGHDRDRHLGLAFPWTVGDCVVLRQVGSSPLSADTFGFTTEVGQERRRLQQLGEIVVYEMKYDIGRRGRSVGLKRDEHGNFELETRGITITRRRGRPTSLPGPVNC